jgi:type III pantothenate kinase
MLLAIDVGNTTVTLGIFQGADLRSTWRFATDVGRFADEYGVLMLNLLKHEGISAPDVDEAVMACVVPDLEPVFQDVCSRYFDVKAVVVHAGIKTGLRILYDSPRDVGADRVADAVAAIHKYGAPLIVVDLGTATVFDAIGKDGDYLGGALAPGLGIASEALFRRAARLYRVELSRPSEAIGRNTVTAMQSGILFGYVGLIEGVVSRMKEELGDGVTVIGTGGFAETIAKETDAIDKVDPGLTLDGLRLIHELNRL